MTTTMLDRVLQTVDSRKDASVAALKDFLSIPSVSTKPEHKPDMQRCAQWLADQLQFAAMDVSIMATEGHPIIVAKNKHVPGRPTVLVYGHYDVQPPEPLEKWTSPPFEPTVRNDILYARGSSDDKGQVWAHVEAILAWQAHGGLPINLTLLIEGEEEIGSHHLAAFVQKYRDELRADLAIISDTSQFVAGVPAITYGLRGLVYEEIFLTGPRHDLHSGLYGGAVPNPANVLVELIASLHDADGRVNISGFYDDVLPLTPDERAMWAALPFDEAAYARELGLPFGVGEKGFTSLERTWARPTCDVNGLTAGYQGAGAKTVIASAASAKISMRLVPNQDPAKIRAAFEAAIRVRCPKNIDVKFANHGLARPVLVPADSQAVQLTRAAVEQACAVQPHIIRSGGSIPVVALFRSILSVDTLLLGFAPPDCNAHAPDEKFDLKCLWDGSRTVAVLYEQLTQLKLT